MFNYIEQEPRTRWLVPWRVGCCGDVCRPRFGPFPTHDTTLPPPLAHFMTQLLLFANFIFNTRISLCGVLLIYQPWRALHRYGEFTMSYTRHMCDSAKIDFDFALPPRLIFAVVNYLNYCFLEELSATIC